MSGSISYNTLRVIRSQIDAGSNPSVIADAVSAYLLAHPPSGGVTIDQVKADIDIADSLSKKHSNTLDHSNASDHSHSNKSTLDGYTQSEVNLADAVTKRHSNSNDHVQGSDNETATTVGVLINGAVAGTPPADADNLGYSVSSAPYTIKRFTWANLKAAVIAAITYPTFNSVYRTLLDSSGSHSAAKTANTYGLGQGDIAAVTGTGTLYPLNTIYIAAADYPTIDGKVSKLRVRAVIECNDVAPFTGTFKVGLHPVTRPATSGGAGLCIYTIGSPVTNSQGTLTNPAADSQNAIVSADFDLPADGFYVLAMVTSGTMATSSHIHISASLQIHNT
jgi:hypothetical protein